MLYSIHELIGYRSKFAASCLVYGKGEIIRGLGGGDVESVSVLPWFLYRTYWEDVARLKDTYIINITRKQMNDE